MRRRGVREVPWLLAVPAVGLLVAFHFAADRLRRLLRVHELERAQPRDAGSGSQNFREIFRDPAARGALWHTLELAVCFVVAVNAIGLALALGAEPDGEDAALPAVAVLRTRSCSARSRSRSSGGGSSTTTARSTGSSATSGLDSLERAWLGDPSTALWTILVVMVWQFSGLAMVLYLAGLQGISDDVYEATLVDGASGWFRFRKVVLPLLAPAITVSATLTLIIGLRVFDQVMALTDGGPVDATETLATQVYKQTFVLGRFGYGAALRADPDGADRRRSR